MRFEKLHHLKRAKELLAAGDPDSLRYCCLELRMCIEHLAYERIPLFEKELARDFDKWQPQAVIDAMLDCDPNADKDYSLAMGFEGPQGEPPKKMHGIGRFFAITRKFVQRRYHKLASFLHAPTYAQLREEKAPEPDRKFLEETIADIERLCSSTVESNFGMKVTFTCQDCGKEIVRNTEALRRDGRMVCLEPTCKAVYAVTDLDTPTPKFQMDQFDVDCVCGRKMFVGKHRLQNGARIACPDCKKHIKVTLVWNLVPEEEPSPA